MGSEKNWWAEVHDKHVVLEFENFPVVALVSLVKGLAIERSVRVFGLCDATVSVRPKVLLYFPGVLVVKMP